MHTKLVFGNPFFVGLVRKGLSKLPSWNNRAVNNHLHISHEIGFRKTVSPLTPRDINPMEAQLPFHDKHPRLRFFSSKAAPSELIQASREMNRNLSQFILDDDFLVKTSASSNPLAFRVLRRQIPKEWYDRAQLLRSQIFKKVDTKIMMELAHKELGRDDGHTLLMQKIETIIQPWRDLDDEFGDAPIKERYRMFETFVAFERVLDEADNLFYAESKKTSEAFACEPELLRRHVTYFSWQHRHSLQEIERLSKDLDEEFGPDFEETDFEATE